MTTRERPKRSEVQTPGNTPTRKHRSVSPATAKIQIEGRRVPDNIYVPRKKGPPKGNLPDGAKFLTVAGNASNTVSGAANIVELARALRNDVDLIFEFVYNNIEFIPTYGSQKGALGTLIDGFGNAFDQSELMVELLREAGYTCSFQHGELQLSEQEVSDWLGTDVASIWAASNLLGNCGVPNETHWTGTEWTLRLAHCWVKVTIDATDYVFDPVMKAYNVIESTIDLETALDYDRTDFMNDATSGATITSDYVQDMNRTNVRDNLALITGNLVDYLKTNAPAATLNDILGGKEIVPVIGPVRLTTLPYLRPASTPTTWTDIPNTYKCTLSVLYDDPNIDVSFYSKDVHGKRLTLTFNGSNECELRLDGDLVATSDPQIPDSWNSVLLSVTHPTADPWWNQSFWQTVYEGRPYMIAQAWGNAGRHMMESHRDKLSDFIESGDDATDETVAGETLACWFHLWNAQKSWVCDVFNRMTDCTTVLQHQIGLVGHSLTPVMDLGGIMWSTGALDNNYDNVDTNDTALAMHGIAFEAGSIEQVTTVGGISTTTIIDKAVSDGIKIFDGRSDNWTSTVRPNLTNYNSQTLDDIENWYLNWDWRVAIPQDGEIVKDDFIGMGYYAISPWYGAIGIFSGYLQGGMGSRAYELDEFSLIQAKSSADYLGISVDELLSRVSPPTIPLNTGVNQYSADPVHLRSGSFTYDHVDLTVGSGKFPYQLSFQRFYKSNLRHRNTGLGRGWSHNHEITISKNSDGIIGMAARNPIQGAAGLAQLFVSVDLLRDLTKPLDKWVTVAIANRWMLDHLRNNVVDVFAPEGMQRFTKQPDGTYVSPLGSSNTLVENAGLFTMRTPQGVTYNFNGSDQIESVDFPSGVRVTYAYAGTKLASVSNGMGRSISFSYSGDDITDVSDGNGRTVSFALDMDQNLIAATDAIGEQTAFEYDLPGRMVKIFKPENPTDEIVTNVYDSLARVKEQRDAYNNLTQFYIAGSRTEVIDRAGNSDVRFYDKFGNIVSITDKLGNVWKYEYDGLQRRIKAIAPESNLTRYEFDAQNNLVTVTRVPKFGSGLDEIVMAYEYDANWNKVSSKIDPNGHSTNFHYDLTTGNLLRVELPSWNGVRAVTRYEWNERGQLLGCVDALGMQTQYTYSDLTEELETETVNTEWRATIGGAPSVDDILTITVNDSGLGGGSKSKSYTVQTGDSLQDIASNLAELFNSDSELQNLGIGATVFDFEIAFSSANGNTSTFSWSTSAGATATIAISAGLSLRTSFGYDVVGNSISVTNARGNEFNFEFDNLRRVTKAISAAPFSYETRVTFDKNSNRVKIERYAGLDENDEPIWQTSQASYTVDDLIETTTDSSNNVTEFTYNSRRLMHTSKDAANRIVTRVYDNAGRIVAVDDPGAVSQATYSYTVNGRIETIQDAKTNITTFEYDDFDRLRKRIFPDASFEQNNFDEFGRLASVITRGGDEIAFGYDNANRVVESVMANMPTVSYERNLVGRLTKISTPTVPGDPSSGDFSYLYDSAGRLIQEHYPDLKIVHYEHDENGNVTRLTYPDGYYIEREFDELDRLVEIKLNGQPSSAFSFEYDELSRRRKLSCENGVETFYQLEFDNDVTSLEHVFNGSSIEFLYGFNNVHELVTQSVSNSSYLWHPTTGVVNNYGNSNELNQYPTLDSNSISYNDNGCMTDDGVRTFAYDTLNRLVSVTDGVVSSAYLYDPRGRRSQKEVSGIKTQYIHSGIRLLSEYDGTTGNLLKRYVYGAGFDEVILEVTDANEKIYLHHDRIGSVIATTDDTGVVLNSYGYSPWGECGSVSGTTFGFQGQCFDSETGLYFMKSRHYDPKLGRFIQPDPIGYGDGLNLYEFAYNNPTNFSDPLGLAADGSVGGLREYGAGWSYGSAIALPGTPPEGGPKSPFDYEYWHSFEGYTDPSGLNSIDTNSYVAGERIFASDTLSYSVSVAIKPVMRFGLQFGWHASIMVNMFSERDGYVGGWSLAAGRAGDNLVRYTGAKAQQDYMEQVKGGRFFQVELPSSYAPGDVESFVARLTQVAESYDDSARYGPLTAKRNSYNSNSFVAGVLLKAGASLPLVDHERRLWLGDVFPGWEKPLLL